MSHLGKYRYSLMVCICCLLSMTLMAGDGLPSITDSQTIPENEIVFSFYGKPVRAAKLKSSVVRSVHAHDVKQAWHEYENRDVKDVLSSLRSLTDELGLNDWFTFELVRNYVDALLNAATPRDRVLMEHFLLVALVPSRRQAGQAGVGL